MKQSISYGSWSPPLQRRDLSLERCDLFALRLHGRNDHARVPVEIDHVLFTINGLAIGIVLDDEAEVPPSGQRRVFVLVGGQPKMAKIGCDTLKLFVREVLDALLRRASRNRARSAIRRSPYSEGAHAPPVRA